MSSLEFAGNSIQRLQECTATTSEECIKNFISLNERVMNSGGIALIGNDFCSWSIKKIIKHLSQKVFERYVAIVFIIIAV